MNDSPDDAAELRNVGLAGDPTRIPGILTELQRTWEGQPDLPLATLFGILSSRGVGWGTPDDELVAALRAERMAHPSELARDADGRVAAPYLVETQAPDHSVTFSGVEVVVRSLRDRDRQPSVWDYESVRPTGPGRPLVVRDCAGVEHRLGVVNRIEAVESENASKIDGLERADVGNAVWLVVTDCARVTVTHRIHVWEVSGRGVNKTAHAWNQVVRCRVEEEFVFSPAGGGEAVSLGVVEKIVLLES